MPNETKIIDKIKKLFALAKCDGAAGAESENAMRMANALLAKHSIEMYKLTGSDQDVFVNFESYNTKTAGNKSIIGWIAKLYNCRVIYDNRGDGVTVLIIGTDANRMTATIVIEQILDQVKKECKGKNAAYKHGVAVGLGDVIGNIINEREKDKEEVVPGTGLIPIDIIDRELQAARDFIDEKFKDVVPSRQRRTNYSAEGREHGNRLNPGARVTGEAQRRLS